MSEQKPNRRLFLAAGSAATVFAGLKGAVAMPGNDAEIIALSAEVLRLNEVADEISETRIEPFSERVHELLRDDVPGPGWGAKGWAYSRESGHEAAIDDQRKIDDQADAAFARMMAIPCATNAGRAAKVRALLIHTMRGDWRGPDSELNWPERQARALLGEFAGMSTEELADV